MSTFCTDVSSFREPGDLESPQYARAIYAYAAQSIDEVNLQEGDAITILRTQDDGWCRGIVNGLCGLFPGNYHEPCDGPPAAPAAAGGTEGSADAGYHVKALYDYSGEQASNLAMMTGDVFAVIADFDPEWFEVRRDQGGATGFIPKNYAERCASPAKLAARKPPANLPPKLSKPGPKPAAAKPKLAPSKPGPKPAAAKPKFPKPQGVKPALAKPPGVKAPLAKPALAKPPGVKAPLAKPSAPKPSLAKPSSDDSAELAKLRQQTDQFTDEAGRLATELAEVERELSVVKNNVRDAETNNRSGSDDVLAAKAREATSQRAIADARKKLKEIANISNQ